MNTTQDKSIEKPVVTITSNLTEEPNGDMVSGIKVNNNEYTCLLYTSPSPRD